MMLWSGTDPRHDMLRALLEPYLGTGPALGYLVPLASIIRPRTSRHPLYFLDGELLHLRSLPCTTLRREQAVVDRAVGVLVIGGHPSPPIAALRRTILRASRAAIRT